MACIHLQKLYALCQEHELRFHVASSDLVRIVCRECDSQEVCPSNFTVHEEPSTAAPRQRRNGGTTPPTQNG